MTGKSRIHLTAVRTDGTFLANDQEIPARTIFRDIPGASAYREVTICMVIANRDAETIYNALSSGNVSLEISGLKDV